MTSHTDLLFSAVQDNLGAPDTWPKPVGFENSLALCALNSIYSLNAKSKQGQNVLERYRNRRRNQGSCADVDDASDMIQAIVNAGGPEIFAAEVLKNRRVLSGGSLRTSGLLEGLNILMADGVNTLGDLQSATEDELKKLGREWQRVRGLGPASWDYVLMNAGLDGIKVDVRVRRFFNRAAGAPGNRIPDQLIKEVSARLGTTKRELDRAVWCFESGEPGCKDEWTRKPVRFSSDGFPLKGWRMGCFGLFCA